MLGFCNIYTSSNIYFIQFIFLVEMNGEHPWKHFYCFLDLTHCFANLNF